MNARQGFTLIEVLVSVAIATLLTAALLTSFYQSNRLVNGLDDYMDIYANAILIEQQMSKDIAGAFIPRQAIAASQAQKKLAPRSSEQRAQQSPVAGQSKKQKKKSLLKDSFVSKNKEDNIEFLTFITNNPMRVYWGDKTGGPKASIVRVVYSLEQHSSRKGAMRYTLYRQEGQELELKPYRGKQTNIERYPLVDNIKSFKLEFIATEEPEPKKEGAGGAKQTKSQEPEKQTFSDWFTGKDKKDLRTKVKLPDEVILTLELWDSRYRRSHEFSFTMPISAPYSEPKPDPPIRQPRPGASKMSLSQQKGAQQNKKDLLVSGAQSIMDNLRRTFG